MAKDKRKSNKQEFNPKKALKYFTLATVELIVRNLENISVEDLIDALFIYNEDKNADLEYLIREYEKQVLMAKMQPDQFKIGLHDFFLKMADYLKEKNLYLTFFELVYKSYFLLTQKKQDEVCIAYFDLLVQQYSYLTGTSQRIVYGLSNKKKILVTDEVGKYLTEINNEIHMLAKQGKLERNDFIRTARKYGYNVHDDMELDRLINYDRLACNMIFLNAFFINEDNIYMHPKPYRDLTQKIKTNIEFFKDVYTLSGIKSKLETRQDILPSKGVLIKVKNCNDVIEIYLEEVTRLNRIFLLYKIKFIDNTYLTGFYDNKYAMASYTFDTGEDSLSMQYQIEKIVLENYLNLTCDLTTEEREKYIDFVEEDHESLPVMIYSKKEKSTTNEKEEHFRVFDRREYRAELKGVKGYIRKLPVGATASDEAIKKAEKLGIELRPNETFVTDFIKKVYKKH